MNQLQTVEPNFLIFKYTQISISEIRSCIYETYALVADWDTTPSMEDLQSEENTLEDLYKRIASERAFDDQFYFEDQLTEVEIEVFDSYYSGTAPMVTHDIREILFLDNVFFEDYKTLYNIPIVRVW